MDTEELGLIRAGVLKAMRLIDGALPPDGPGCVLETAEDLGPIREALAILREIRPRMGGMLGDGPAMVDAAIDALENGTDTHYGAASALACAADLDLR